MWAQRRLTGSLRAARFFLCCCYAGFCLPPALAQDSSAQPEEATGWKEKPSVFARRFMAVTANPHATDAAVEILALGGSAVDAAIAAQLVLNLVEPQSSGIGGGGFLLYFDATRKRTVAYDGRETAPAAATAQRFLDGEGNPLPFSDAVATGKSVGVPGLVALLALAHERYGRLRWERLFRPAIRLAEQGFAVSPRLNQLLARDPFLRADANARRLYYESDGTPLSVGARLTNPAFAATLRQLAEEGPQAFYRGDIARDIIATVAAHPRAAGDIAMADFAAYHAVERDAVCGTYRRYRICGMPPPSSGGIAVQQILGLLERTAYKTAAPNSPQAVHYFTEAGRLAFADRRRYLADPDFVAVPSRELLNPGYLDTRARLITAGSSLGSAQPGKIGVVPAHADDTAPELPATSHLSIVDGRGNAVALTSSIEAAFGSRIAVRGFLLNNQLTDFSFRPAGNGRLAANRVEPGKRPLSSMAPTLVFDSSGRLYAVLGSPGGNQIINYVAQVLTALLDWHMAPDDALAQPHFASRNGPTELEQGTAVTALAPALQKLGHRVELHEMTSGLHLVVRSGIGWRGAADPRREGVARGG